ncbi:hypothetical protein N7470_000498 [Penicillium chermesinum]|nr:hypothetical protein N7470_000498 [Penicillium chermesinum]
MQIKNLAIACILTLGCESLAAPNLSSTLSTSAGPSTGTRGIPSSFATLSSATKSPRKQLVHASTTPTSTFTPITSSTTLPIETDSKSLTSVAPTANPQRIKIRRRVQAPSSSHGTVRPSGSSGPKTPAVPSATTAPSAISVSHAPAASSSHLGSRVRTT